MLADPMRSTKVCTLMKRRVTYLLKIYAAVNVVMKGLIIFYFVHKIY